MAVLKLRGAPRSVARRHAGRRKRKPAAGRTCGRQRAALDGASVAERLPVEAALCRCAKRRQRSALQHQARRRRAWVRQQLQLRHQLRDCRPRHALLLLCADTRRERAVACVLNPVRAT